MQAGPRRGSAVQALPWLGFLEFLSNCNVPHPFAIQPSPSLPILGGPARAALPAVGELAFELLAALRAAPVPAAKLAAVVSRQKRDQQLLRAVVLPVVGYPYTADVERQLAPAARQEFAAHRGGDAVRFQESLDQVGLWRVPGDVDLLHVEQLTPPRFAAHVC